MNESVSEMDAENDWNTTGRLSGCYPASEGSPQGHGLDCECPPYTCNDCNQSQPQREPCGCFISLEGMPLADIKALFAADESDGPTLSIGGLGPSDTTEVQ